MNAGKFFGIVMWSDDDIVEACRNCDIEPTEEIISRVSTACRNGHLLEDTMIGSGWDVIYSLINEYSGDSRDKELHSLEVCS